MPLMPTLVLVSVSDLVFVDSKDSTYITIMYCDINDFCSMLYVIGTLSNQNCSLSHNLSLNHLFHIAPLSNKRTTSFSLSSIDISSDYGYD